MVVEHQVRKMFPVNAQQDQAVDSSKSPDTVLCWVTIMDPEVGFTRKQMQVPKELAKHEHEEGLITVVPSFLCDIKGRIVVGIAREDIEAYVRQSFHNDPELNDDRIDILLQQAFAYEFSDGALALLAQALQMSVDEVKLRIAYVEMRKEDWFQGQQIFVGGYIESATKPQARNTASSDKVKRSKRKR